MFLRVLGFTIFGLVTATKLGACPNDDRILLLSCDTSFSVQFESLAHDVLAPDGVGADWVVTGAYSSADRYGVEGIAIANGVVISRRFQGWDGLAIIPPDGTVSLHHVERVSTGGQTFNLRVPEEIQAFIRFSETHNLSVFQSHLLVTDGAIDVRDRDNQPRFRRRVLFVTQAGDVGLFDTAGDRLTLFDTARALHGIGAVMAFNLDMGAYDYCSTNGARCGLLRRENTRILTNVLRFIVN